MNPGRSESMDEISGLFLSRWVWGHPRDFGSILGRFFDLGLGSEGSIRNVEVGKVGPVRLNVNPKGLAKVF